MPKLIIDSSWTLFLDRDGVINEKLENDYVKNWDEFKFKEGALQAIAGLGKIFGRVFVVTNQRGVGLGLMTEEILNEMYGNIEPINYKFKTPHTTKTPTKLSIGKIKKSILFYS